jgi:hypothetical protein
MVRATSPAFIWWKASLMSLQAAALGHHVVEIEAAGGLLCIDDRRDGAEQRATERRLERPPAEAGVEPLGARTRSGDRGRMIMSRVVFSIGLLPPGFTAADLTIATKHVAA